MEGNAVKRALKVAHQHHIVLMYAAVLAALVFVFSISAFLEYGAAKSSAGPMVASVLVSPPPQPHIDKADYDRRMRALAHLPADPATDPQGNGPGATTNNGWPVTDAPYPNVGALLPYHRIVAYYGNFYSTSMGVLGEYPPDVAMQKLGDVVKEWQAADPSVPVLPAIDYIAVTAQGGAGQDGTYRARMPDQQIEKALGMAEQMHGILILEVQPGLADLMTEVRSLEPYLSMPNVHLAIDPEFVMMHRGIPPGKVVGTVDAKDVNDAAQYLAALVKEHHLPPKVLIVHRYTQWMVTHARQIKPLPQVQVVIDMDGWGPPAQKISTYKQFVEAEPVQFTGFKLFYKNDVRQPGSRMLTPKEVLSLTPSPVYIQYQ